METIFKCLNIIIRNQVIEKRDSKLRCSKGLRKYLDLALVLRRDSNEDKKLKSFSILLGQKEKLLIRSELELP